MISKNAASAGLLAMLSLTAVGSPQVPGADRADLQSAFAAARHAVRPAASGHHANNPASRLDLRFDGRGFTATSPTSDWTWGLALEHYGYEGALLGTGEPEAVEARGNRISYRWSEDLEEWYVNDRPGLEHGYTLRRRLENPSGAEQLRFSIDVLGELVPEVSSSGRDVRFLDPEGVAALTYAGLCVFDADGVQLPAAFERVGDDLLLKIDERKATYPVTIDPIVQTTYIKASNAGANDSFGWDLDMSGDTVAISAVGEDSGATGVGGDGSDNSIAGSGAVYVFVRSGTTWVEQAYIKSSNPDVFDNFGWDIALSGDTLVVGAPSEDSAATTVGGNQLDNSAEQAGAAYVFARTGSTWSQQAYLKAPNADIGDSFGKAVAVSGDYVVVGAPDEDSAATGIQGDASDNSLAASGAAYLFVRNGTQWSHQLYLKATNPDVGDFFGYSVAVEGDVVLVGAPSEASLAGGIDADQTDNSGWNVGAVYAFRRTGELWSVDAYLKPQLPSVGDIFGDSLAISGSTAVIGARWEDGGSMGVGGLQSDESVSSSGAAFVFDYDGSAWHQSAYLKASNTGSNDSFGQSVDISGDRIVVSATNERSQAFGVDGDQQDDSLVGAGAVYAFRRVAGTWSQEAYLKSSNPAKQQFFGQALAIDGGTVVASSTWEKSSATGINGDQDDESAPSSGAGYLFELDSDCGATAYGPDTGVNIGKLWSYSAPVEGGKYVFELSEFQTTGLAFLMISGAPDNSPLLGGTLLVDPNLSVFGPNQLVFLLLQGEKTSYQIPVLPGLGGLTFYAQGGMFDFAMPSSIALTNGLEIKVCP
ncbi:MAG: hypothetical protein P1V81_08660 [Planctomycetota bacterium]|nr:hypothetical protein [Planctomycetota bacterium]